MRTVTRSNAWIYWLVAGVLAVVAVCFVPSNTWYGNASYDLVGLTSTIAIVVGVRIGRPAHPQIWYVFALWQGTWVVGDVLYGWYAFVLAAEPFPAPADAFYLAGYLVGAAGLFMLIRRRTAGQDRAGLIDACVISAGLALVYWDFVMRPIADDNSAETFSRMISLAYPIGDVLLLAMVARLLASPGAWTISYRLLALGVLLRLGADVIYSIDTAFSEYSGVVTDPAWMLSYLCCAAAALHPSMTSLANAVPTRSARFSLSRLWLLASSSLLAPLLLIFQGMTQPPAEIDWLAIGIGAMMLFLLVLSRMAGLVNQVQDQATQLEALAHHDGLTGVANRRAWDLELVRKVALASRTSNPLTVGLIDLDHFKRFNDQHGHQAGDRLLTQAAAVWQANLREPDYLARYGGEEFGVLLSDTTAADAVVVLERLLAATPDGQTFSAGLATWDGAETVEQLLGRVDKALYQAKDAGRNQVVVSGPTAENEVVEFTRSAGLAGALPG